MPKPLPLEIRFAVMHNDTPVSAIWRVWCSENRQNLMLSSSRIATITKATFHHKNKDGYSHLAVTRAHRERMLSKGYKMPMLVDELKWYRPIVFSAEAIIPAARILMPGAYLAPSKYHTNKPLIALSPTTVDKASVVSLLFTKRPKETWKIPGHIQLLGSVEMSTGETAVLIADEIPFDATDFTKRHQPKVTNLAPNFLTERTKHDSKEPHRAMFYTDPNVDGNVLSIVDVGGIKIQNNS